MKNCGGKEKGEKKYQGKKKPRRKKEKKEERKKGGKEKRKAEEGKMSDGVKWGKSSISIRFRR